MKSYIGLATPRGLESLVPEQAHVAQALAAHARDTRSVCCWAVLPDADAAEIGSRLAAGESADALALLEAAAQSVGRITLDDAEA